MKDFAAWFEKATGNKPFPYQIRMAQESEWPALLDIPTGLGKTAAVLAGWLWRRKHHSDDAVKNATPRRLVYCLPMRVLVEQTFENAVKLLQEAGDLAGLATWDQETGRLTEYQAAVQPGKVAVRMLMGGAVDNIWEGHPEAECILIGTQDQLLSRALNRGYAMSRYKWPIHFGALHNDALWVMDETQLMGVGVETTAQLDGLRGKLGTYGPTRSLWLSATLNSDAIATIDHPVPTGGFLCLTLDEQDEGSSLVQQRTKALKNVRKATTILCKATEKKYALDLASEVLAAHVPGTLTLVVVNRVPRAQDLFLSLVGNAKKNTTDAVLALIHARMRPADRAKQEAILLGPNGPAGRIVVATQAVEAGVDVSARTLVTELAPWPSLVQRIGRCNRYGEQENARVIWVDIEAKDEKDPLVLPYDAAALNETREAIVGLDDAGPASLRAIGYNPPKVIRPVLRRKDLLDLFDTTPDLSGNDLDVSRYIRDGNDNDVQVFWRNFEGDSPAEGTPAPVREELCSVSIGAMSEFLKPSTNRKIVAWRWNPLAGEWEKTTKVRPGNTILLHINQGGYSSDTGWTGEFKDKPTEVALGATTKLPEAELSADPDSFLSRWVTLSQHSIDITDQANALTATLQQIYVELPWGAVKTASRWHDLGKSHEAFQNMLPTTTRPNEPGLWAKSDKNSGHPRYWVTGEKNDRPGFRHELASALAWLQLTPEHEEHKNLVAYLIAAHHGKVRLNIRSLPTEAIPADEEQLFARGVWDGDVLPEVDLGEGVIVPGQKLDLSYMNLGEGPRGQSWLARTLSLRDSKELGPFRLALLESLVRVADWRASKKETSDVVNI